MTIIWLPRCCGYVRPIPRSGTPSLKPDQFVVAGKLYNPGSLVNEIVAFPRPTPLGADLAWRPTGSGASAFLLGRIAREAATTMQLDNRSRATLSLVGGILGMVVQERLSLIPNDFGVWGGLLTLALSLALLVFSQRASFRAGYEQARRETRPRIAAAEAN